MSPVEVNTIAGASTSKTSARFMMLSVGALAIALAYHIRDAAGNDSITLAVPAQSVFVSPASFAVLGNNGTFREDAFAAFNPTGTTPPFFQIFDAGFLKILGPNPSITEIASNATFAFAHEAPIYDAAQDAMFFASNSGGALGMSDINHNNQVGRLDLQHLPASLNGTAINIPVTKLDLPDTVQMTNGGTGPYQGDLLFVNSGRGPLPPSIVRVNPAAPHNTTVLVDNFFGRQFNSLNDIKVHPSGKIFFTDTVYGWLNHFRPLPLLPSQVYVLDPTTRQVRVVATDFDKSNGIAFSGDGKTAFITDTGAVGGFLGTNQTHPATIYAFDVDSKSFAFTNRRIFAYVDTGIPDGVQVDTDGNVYAGCADGVHVWNAVGTLLGKIFLGVSSANMAFAGKGRLVIMAETKVFLAELATSPSLFTS
ncbi:unnamed protein product [Mycena citricolor]|uniref:SMP-30/Gluconolactonase/LRE-like region domain-containing protein n=1 Tax=Mycena citricolor TaxID=2018698 RepID=A0AAD2HFX5_9AGAR|nr:unnamed protein product [Mycena citricolor]